jgi:hypothetical protein
MFCRCFSLAGDFFVFDNLSLGETAEAGSLATWLASVNSTYLSEHPDRESAMARVEAAITHNMELVLHDWELYRAGKAER